MFEENDNGKNSHTFFGSNLHLGKNVNNLTLDNSKVITKTISSEGKVNVMLKSKQNIEKSSAKHIGFNFGEKTPGKFNIGYSWHESGSTPEESDLVSEDSKNANLDITRIKDDDYERSGGVSGKLNFSGDIGAMAKEALMNAKFFNCKEANVSSKIQNNFNPTKSI